jgi:hypothetical protein
MMMTLAAGFGLAYIRDRCAHRLAVRTPPSHGGNTGSSPVGRAKFHEIVNVARADRRHASDMWLTPRLVEIDIEGLMTVSGPSGIAEIPASQVARNSGAFLHHQVVAECRVLAAADYVP